jgi:hypothetical protein
VCALCVASWICKESFNCLFSCSLDFSLFFWPDIVNLVPLSCGSETQCTLSCRKKMYVLLRIKKFNER